MRECIKTWRRDGFRIDLYDVGRSYLAYRLRDRGETIFDSELYCPSPMYAWDSLDAVYDLLGFLTLKPGDTDKEYFSEYTERQLEWCQSDRAQELAFMVYDFEERKQRK